MVDVASQYDKRKIALDEVGIADLQLPIKVKTMAGPDFSTIGNFTVSVSLADDVKGTHMSRLMEMVYVNKNNISQTGLFDMTNALLLKLGATSSRVIVEFPYAVTRYSPTSGLENEMVYKARFDASHNSGYKFRLGVTVDVMSVCPCALEECNNGSSHVQRGEVSIDIQSKIDAWIWLEQLIEVAEHSGSSPVYDRLKRPDEKQVVLTGFAHPKFVEDITRDCVTELQKIQGIEAYRVSCKNFESIHQSNCQAVKYFNWE